MSRDSLTQAKLKRLLSYDSGTGVFTWKVKTSSNVRVGDVAGTNQLHGYRAIHVQGILYLSHRLAWLYVHGHWPSDEIDHINGIRDDNRIINLREATRQENCQNISRPCNNTSGTMGVSFENRRNKWRAYIVASHGSRKAIHLGLFVDKDDAIEARHAAEKKYGFHANHGR